MDKQKDNEQWKRNVEGNARIIAERVKESGIIITSNNKDAPEEMKQDICECLLKNYNIKRLLFEGHEDVNVFILNSCRNEEFIKKVIEPHIPEIKSRNDELRKKLAKDEKIRTELARIGIIL